MNEYVLWGLIGILFLILTILGILAIRFFRQKSVQPPPESYQHQQNANLRSNFPVGSHSQTTEHAIDDLRRHLSDLKPLLQALIDESKGMREDIEHITVILQNYVAFQSQNINLSFQEGGKVPASCEDTKESSQFREDKTNEQIPQFPSQEMEEPLQQIHSEPSERMSPALMDFCNLYNNNEQSELQTRYQRLSRVAAVNTIERFQNPNEPPLFENKTNGEFIVFYIKEEDFYAVVPYFGQVLGDGLYGPGAFDKVFKCHDFDSRYNYSITVILPARFEPDNTKEKWTLLKQGEVELETIS